MNKKNKNKNRSKPTNITPPLQKAEPALITPEAITILTEGDPVSLVKENESTIETSCQATQQIDDSDFSSDTPKKPKRNKGKKKKQEEISLEEENPTSIVPSSVQISEVKVKDERTVDTIEIKVEEEDKNKEENITPSTRKKKNKKKTSEPKQVEEISQSIEFAEKLEESKKEDIVKDNATDLDLNISQVMEPDTKQSKKKNKKKKHRHDSEKSDKTDETITCTAAFQKLISSTDNAGDISPQTNIESTKDSCEGDKSSFNPISKETLKDIIESVLLPEQPCCEDEALQEDRKNESKGKKKVKRDKKQQLSKEDIEKTFIKKDQAISEEPLELNKTVSESSSIKEVESELKDITSKGKAKIAKPVGKKRRDKIEYIENDKKESQNITVLSEIEIKESAVEKEQLLVNVCESLITPDTNIQNTDEIEKADEKSKSEITTVISDKSFEVCIPPQEINPVSECNLNLTDENIEITPKQEMVECPIEIPLVVTPVILKPDNESENDSRKPFLPLKVPEGKDNISPSSSQPYKTVEKKKKKHPKKIDVSGDKNSETKVLLTPEKESKEEETLQKQGDGTFSNLSTFDDVEISSLKTDELDGSVDVTPDYIHHPLATSQQLIDDNNNMIIREVTSVEEKLNLQLLIPTEPIIQNSGETPEPVRDKFLTESTNISTIRERNLTNEPEKTDLKSKMMEVSQDMEELRLSIERSLAELTSMEKSEQDELKGLEKIEDPKVMVETAIPILIKDDLSEENKTLSGDILHEIISHETQNTSKENESIIILPNPEIISEKNEEKMPSPVTVDEYKGDVDVKETPPQVPARKDHKGKGKSKRKGKQETLSQQSTSVATDITTVQAAESGSKEIKKEEKEQSQQKEQSSESNKNKGKQQATNDENICKDSEKPSNDSTTNVVESFEPIENFEDALTSSVDDVNKTFEIIANEVNNTPEITLQNPQINITAPTEDAEPEEPKQNPVTQPKNLLGHPDIPVPSNRTDYKKEKNKAPNMRQAKVKIKDAVDIEKPEKSKQSKESQTENKKKAICNKNALESFSYMTNDNAEYVYKYSFRKVFLQSLCHVCRKELSQRVPCQFCSLVFYCNQKHKDEDWTQHQSLCFAICTIAHLKDQKHLYADAKNITGQNYRLLRMQMIISCEKVLKRKLVPWEQEALLYPRMCADVACREWKQSKLADCEVCGQISYCSERPDHLPASHQRWCRSYALYQKLVHHQQTRGRMEPKLPTKLVAEGYRIPEKINEVLAAMYDEKIDMTDMEYAALTQLATAPLTAAYSHQVATANYSNGISKKTSFVLHIVGAELQFEADVLFKWEVFFLHLKPNIKELRVVLIGPELNPSNLPLDLLGKINLCEDCRSEKRRVLFSFQDKKTYYEYWASDEFLSPDIVCAFNPGIQRSSLYNGKDTWPTAVSCILKLKTPLIVSSYSINELNRDVARIKECSELSGIGFKTISESKCNPFASVRPDRNFITDDEIPLLFKNYCFTILCGV